MTGALLAGLLAGYGIAVPVGAVGAYLVALTAQTSWRVGVGAALGVATADALYAAVAVAAGTAAARVLEPVAGALRWGSVLVLLVVAAVLAVGGVRSYLAGASSSGSAGPRLTPGGAYRRLLAITLVNPMTAVYFSAIVLGGSAGQAVRPGEQVLFVVAAAAASASWQLLLVVGGAALGRALAGPRSRLATSLVSSVVVVALALALALSG